MDTFSMTFYIWSNEKDDGIDIYDVSGEYINFTMLESLLEDPHLFIEHIRDVLKADTVDAVYCAEFEYSYAYSFFDTPGGPNNWQIDLISELTEVT